MSVKRGRDERHNGTAMFIDHVSWLKCEKLFILHYCHTGGLVLTAAFEIIWVFSEIPSCAEGKSPVGFSDSSWTALVQ